MESKTLARDWCDRWACLAAAMIMQACGGLGYTFAVYSQHLKDKLGYDQEDLDDIGAAKDFGYCIGIVGGILYNFTPPWVTVSVGALLHFSGYFMVYVISVGRIEPPFWMMCGFIAIGVGGDSWIDTAAIMTSIQNFQSYRGTAMGVLKAQVGLSGAIFVTLYKAFLKPNVDGYILLVASAPAVASGALAVFIRPCTSNYQQDGVDPSSDGRFQAAYGGTVALGLYLLLSIFIQAWIDVERSWLVFFAVTMLVHFFLISLLVALYAPLRLWLIHGKGKYIHAEEMMGHPCVGLPPLNISSEGDDHPLKGEMQDCQEEDQDHTVSLNSQSMKQKQSYHILEPVREGNTLNDVFTKQEHFQKQLGVEGCSFLRCVQSLDFWLLSLVAMTGPGTGLAVINNFGQMGRSLKSESVEQFVGLISVASCFGRLVAGYGSDLLLKLTPYPRPLCLTLAHLIMTFGCLTLAAGYVPLLYLGSTFVGASYGAFWALTPPIIAEVFGLQNFAALYKLIGACGPVGAYVFSAKLVGHFYDEEAENYHKHGGAPRPFRGNDSDVDNTCIGRQCFGFSMMVLAIVCMVGASVGTVLCIRTRKLYAQLKL